VARIASNCAAERINGGPLVALERLDGLTCQDDRLL